MPTGSRTEPELRVVEQSPSTTGGLDVRPATLEAPDGQRAAGLAAAAIVAVVVLALAGGWLEAPPVAIRAPAAPAVVAPAPPANAVPAAPASVAPHTTPTLGGPVQASFFRRSLELDLLAGRIVAATGRLAGMAESCDVDGRGPCVVQLQGLAGVPIVPADVTSAPGLWAALLASSSTLTMALKVDGDQRLGYLGRIDAVHQPVGIGRLRTIQPTPDTLQLVDGWLLPWRPARPCGYALEASSPCSRPPNSWLTDVDPGGGGQLVPDQAVQVMLPPSAGLAAWPSAGHGRFLVRHVADAGPGTPAWEVMAAIDGPITRLDLSSATP